MENHVLFVLMSLWVFFLLFGGGAIKYLVLYTVEVCGSSGRFPVDSGMFSFYKDRNDVRVTKTWCRSLTRTSVNESSLFLTPRQ